MIEMCVQTSGERKVIELEILKKSVLSIHPVHLSVTVTGVTRSTCKQAEMHDDISGFPPKNQESQAI
ncbi:unnamed protein product [Periconia digitata]|uniref:Uncharacterized protein n=1 Tax=Periconia digitata TaxID=1303443 RepID=A0A9W4XXE7_9PLEO|nr:unnamed protein product [Periconia digitata]